MLKKTIWPNFPRIIEVSTQKIRDPEKTYSGSRIPDPGVKKASDPGSGSATLSGLKGILSQDGRGEAVGSWKQQEQQLPQHVPGGNPDGGSETDCRSAGHVSPTLQFFVYKKFNSHPTSPSPPPLLYLQLAIKADNRVSNFLIRCGARMHVVRFSQRCDQFGG